MKRVEPKNKNISSESTDVKANSDFETQKDKYNYR